MNYVLYTGLLINKNFKVNNQLSFLKKQQITLTLYLVT